MSYSWPKLDSEYDISVHAIGRIITIWNSIEGDYGNLLRYTVTGWRTTPFLINELNNSQKVALIKYSIESNAKLYKNIIPDINRFLRYAQICNGNRNFFSHATIGHDEENVFLFKGIKSKIGATTILESSTDFIRQIANEMEAVQVYGSDLFKALIKHDRTADFKSGFKNIKLPSAPPQPKSWDTHHLRHIHQAQTNPFES